MKALAQVLAGITLLGMSAGVIALTPIDAHQKLNRAVVKLDTGAGHCTASKIGPSLYLTARHCINGRGMRLEHGFLFLWPSYITVAISQKSYDRYEDWALIHTSDDHDEITPLKLGCGETLTPGMGVAYLGFSGPVDRAFDTGQISSVGPIRNGRNDSDFTITVSAAPGASGSPIISLETGNVIGILVEGVYEARAGFFLIGVQSVNDLPQCKGQVVAS